MNGNPTRKNHTVEYNKRYVFSLADEADSLIGLKRLSFRSYRCRFGKIKDVTPAPDKSSEKTPDETPAETPDKPKE